MKKIFVLLIVSGFITMSFSPLGGISDEERNAAIKHLTKTKAALLKQVKGLSEEQLNFKPDADTWSVAECVEHIAITEGNLSGLIQMTLKNSNEPEKEKVSDEMVLKIITDRSNKVKTNEQSIPKNSFGSYQGSLKGFKAKREDLLKYVKSTQDDLHDHYFDFPFGATDGYQIILFISGHCERHTAQIAEVMAHPNFPKK